MTSLRARLMLGLLGLAAVGLLIVDLVSYLELRSYLTDRVDQQVAAALDPAGDTLGVGPLQGGPRPARGLRPKGAPPPFVGTKRSKAPAPSAFAPPPGRRPPPRPFGPALPPGTGAFLLSASGHPLERRTFSYGEPGLPRPRLPSSPPVSPSVDAPRVFTVGATSGSAGFRAAAVHPFGSNRTVVAAVPLAEVDQTLSQLRLIGGIVTAAVLAALAALAWWVIRVGLRPLERMTETANAIAAGDLSRRVASTDERTEVGRLGVSFNRMLERIEDAFARREASEERLRQFLADASHELRTPLSSIRGYAELFRLGAADDPAELDTAMRRIEDEAARMGGLVDDLLLLARLDQVREPVRERVDLALLAADAAEDARAAAPARAIDVAAGGGAEVLGDPDQLRQVAANLLANAIAHTPPEAPIEVAVAAADREVRMRVRDHGAGLPAGAEARVFQRFWRDGAPQGSNAGGSGLGLAIVAAIADAHGGSAAAANAPGGGAEFTVALPRAGVPTAAPRG
jgi:two-component system, OmpR family, sensor kinase